MEVLKLNMDWSFQKTINSIYISKVKKRKQIMNKNIEVEGGEIAILNSHGDLAIIPKDKRDWVKQKLSEGCHDCIDSLVETLPVASDYAQDGSVYPPNKKVKINQNNQIKEYAIISNEYRDLYNSGKLMSYDENTDTYIATPLKEVTITAEVPQWLKYKRDYEKINPKSDYINSYLTPFAKSLGNTETNYPKRLDDEYEQKSLDYVSEQLIKNKPQGKLSRVEWLNQMSDKEEELIKRNPKYQSSLWADTKRGLTSLVEQNPLQTFQNILNSSDYTNREKQEMLKDYNNHPVMSKLGDATKILNPLTVPSKMVQSSYKDDYSFSDALKGKKNNAGIVEDIVTDPLNLVGLGIWGKLSKANKFKNLDEAYNAIKTLDKVSLEKQLGNAISNEDWQYLYRVQEKGFDIEKPTLKAIEDRVSAGEGKWYDHNILNNPELRSNIQSRDKYYGQWFDSDPKRLDYYLADKGEEVDILRTKVPKKILDQYKIDKIDPEIAKKWSLSHETEYIVPKDLIQQAEKFDKKDWQKLIDEHEKIKQIRKHKIDKVIDATKAGSKVLNKIDDAVNNINRIKFDDFKNDNEFFRIIVGDEAFDDIVQTQKIRTKQPSSVKNTPPNTINLDRRGSTAFPSFSKGSPSLRYANDNPNHYIIRTADESIKPSTSGRHGKGTTMFPTDKSGKHLTELDASKVQVYKHVGNGEYELVNTAKSK